MVRWDSVGSCEVIIYTWIESVRFLYRLNALLYGLLVIERLFFDF